MSDVVAEMLRAESAFGDPTLDLLHQKDAQVITAIFNACFPRETRSIPIDRMHTLVEQMLDDLRARGYGARLPDRSGRELCSKWRNRQWLVRDFDDEVGGEVYRLTSGAQSALQTVRNLTRERTSVNEHRISTIVAAVRALNAKANPDRLARINVLEQQRQDLEREVARLLSGAPMEVPSDEYMLEGFLDLLSLIGDMPGDFQRVEESFARQRSRVLDEFRAQDKVAGQVVDAYLEQADALMDTTEGRAFLGALELLRDEDMLDRLGSDLQDLLDLPAAADILLPSDRAELAGMVRTMVAGVADVVARRQRVTAVLRQNIHTYNAEQDRRLEAVLHQLDAAFAGWISTTGPRTQVTLELLPGRPEIKHLRERMHDPNDDAPLEPLVPANPDDAPTALSLEQVRALGGPNMAQLRRDLEDHWANDPAGTLATAFVTLPDTSRRPADLLGALQIAADSDLVGWAEGTEPIETIRPDGTVRTWQVPRVAVGAAQTTIDEVALADLIEDLTEEIA